MTKENIESRLANRTHSIFSAFGDIINNFYLEAGIYFVGGFNAALVAWDIYTDLAEKGQPLLYAIALAIVAFVAVEGLAVYLVGAAAKTNSRLLWVFSVIFAAFFTYAHYKEMSSPDGGLIGAYIRLAIPFFVVIGYWARTVKNDLQIGEAKLEVKAQQEAEYNKKKEAEQVKKEEIEQAEQSRIAADERSFDQEEKRKQSGREHEFKMARLASRANVPKVSRANVPKESQGKALEKLKPDILAELKQGKPNLTNLSSRLGIGRSTLYRHLGTLVGTGEITKNGNGYELPLSFNEKETK